MLLVDAAPNFERHGVIGGFILSKGVFLMPTISAGLLLARGVEYRTSSGQILPGAPANQQSWLFRHTTGFYWVSSPTAYQDPDDAFIGWVVTDASTVVAVSGQQVAVPDPDENVTVVPVSGGAVMAQGGGGIELPGPVRNLYKNLIDYSDPATVHFTGGADLPSEFNGFDGCEGYLVVDSLSSDPIPIGHQYHDPSDTSGPWTYDIRYPRPNIVDIQRLYMVSRNATKSNELITAAGPNQTPYVEFGVTARPDATMSPDQPSDGDLSLYSLTEYHSDAAGNPKVRLQVQVDPIPDGATWFTGWVNMVSDNPATAKWVINTPVNEGGDTVLDMSTLDQPAAGETWYIYVTANNVAHFEQPSGTSAKIAVSILAVSAPDQISNWSYALVPAGLDAAGIPQYYLDLTFDMPSDPRYFVSRVYRRWYTDATFTVLADPPYDAWSGEIMGLGAHAVRGATGVTERHGPYIYGEFAQHQQFKAQAVARARDGSGDLYENTVSPPTLNITIPASDGIQLDQVDGSTLGGGLKKNAVSGKPELATTNLSNLVYHNADFESGINGWAGVNCTIEYETSIYYGTKGSLKINKRASGTYEGAASEYLISCRPGEKFRIKGWVRSLAGASGTIKIQVNYLDADKVAFSAATSSTITATTTWTELSATFTATAAAHLLVLFITEIATGNWYVDSVRFRQVVEDDAELADGLLAKAALFGTNVRPLMIVSSLPSLPHADYPVGQAVVNTADGKLYRNKANAWTKAIDELDVSAVYAAAVIAGFFDGHSLRLTVSDVETEVRNLYDSDIGQYAGLRVKKVSTGQKVVITPEYCYVKAPSGPNVYLFSSSTSALCVANYSSHSATLGSSTAGPVLFLSYNSGSKIARMIADAAGGRVEIEGQKVVGERVTGWGTPSGTATRSSFATSSVTLSALAERVKALIDDLKTHGLLGS